jgi:hypothetical protein
MQRLPFPKECDMRILLDLAAASGIFSLATLAWGCLLARRRSRAACVRRSRTPPLHRRLTA